MLALLAKIESERVRQNISSIMQNEFSQRLGGTTSWDELVKAIVEYPHKIAPQADVLLYVLDADKLMLKPEAACSRDGVVELRPDHPSPQYCISAGSMTDLFLPKNHRDALDTTALAGDLLPAKAIRNGAVSKPQAALLNGEANGHLASNQFDLQLITSGQQLGLIHLEFPEGKTAGADEIRALKSVVPVIALALEGALLQNLAARQAAESETQRQEIAQNLHDNLAQNISYLRLKLDQLTGVNAIREIGVVLQELENMRASADEAYQQVRDTLSGLNPIQSDDLETALIKQAGIISQRSGLELRTISSGSPYGLGAVMRQQILYIAREALHNVEKHARAQHICVQFVWLDSELIIKILDDGAGFDPRAVSPTGHYGLWIMQQRAMDIGGTLKIQPGTERGTEVTLWVPHKAYLQGIGEGI